LTLRATYGRAGSRSYAGARAHLRYAAASGRTGPRLAAARLFAGRGVQRAWWGRLTDDRELVGAKLLVLAALQALTALLERVV
jgi:hypothetical protein